MQAKEAGLPRSSERYLQPAVKPPSGDGTHAGRHAGPVIRLDCGICGQLHSAALQLSEPPTGKTVQATVRREREKSVWGKKDQNGETVEKLLSKKVKSGYVSSLFTCTLQQTLTGRSEKKVYIRSDEERI